MKNREPKKRKKVCCKVAVNNTVHVKLLFDIASYDVSMENKVVEVLLKPLFEPTVLGVSKCKFLRKFIIKIANDKLYNRTDYKIYDTKMKRVNGSGLRVVVDIEGPVLRDLLKCLHKMDKNGKNKYADMLERMILKLNDKVTGEEKKEFIRKMLDILQEEICELISSIVTENDDYDLKLEGVQLLEFEEKKIQQEREQEAIQDT